MRACEAAGIARASIAVDPGIGFGKTAGHNLAILGSLAVLDRSLLATPATSVAVIVAAVMAVTGGVLTNAAYQQRRPRR